MGQGVHLTDRPRRSWTQWIQRWEIILAALLAVVFMVNTQLSPYFLDIYNLIDSTFNFSEKAIIALPMALLIIAREIDLSVASTIALASVFMGLTSEAGAHVTTIVAVGLLTGLGAGLVNGLVVTRFGVHSIVVTIGTLSLYRGIAFVILGDGAITAYPPDFAFFGQGYLVAVLPFEFMLFLLLAVLFAILLHLTTTGRRIYAIGNNPVAARFSGIRVDRYRLALFCATGLASGLASVLLTSRIGSTRPNIAMGWELEVITMVVLGGVSIMGGSGTIPGVFLAVLLMGTVTFGLALLNVPGIVVSIFAGSLLILAITLPVVIGHVLRRG